MIKLLISFLFCLSSLAALENSSQQLIVNSTGGYWDEYYQNTLNATKPHNTLLLAQQYFEIDEKASGLAVDLGTGTSRDALFLLKKEWKVLAIDAEVLAYHFARLKIFSNAGKKLLITLQLEEDLLDNCLGIKMNGLLIHLELFIHNNKCYICLKKIL